jgi:hypothetical protein
MTSVFLQESSDYMDALTVTMDMVIKASKARLLEKCPKKIVMVTNLQGQVCGSHTEPHCFLGGGPYQVVGCTFMFKDLTIGACSYFDPIWMN